MAKRLWLLGLGAMAMVGFTHQAKANLLSPSADVTSVTQETPRIVLRQQFADYRQVIERTRSMLHDQSSQTLADRWGLDIVDVTWEDTGRYDNSAVGPNISDMTIQVQQKDPDTGEYSLHLMPVIRYPNFADITGDVPMDQFYLLTGNEKGDDLERVSLKDVLGDLRSYLSEPDSWSGTQKSLLADRDSHVLVSAQAAFLPIPQGEGAIFNPVLFNYQSYPGDPAVLTLLVTREGTSATIIDNQRDGFDAGHTWGQRLFFNQNGERTSLTGQRLSDFQVESSEGDVPSVGELPVDSAAEAAGLNMVMLIQVPLKQKQPFLPQAPIAPAAALMEAEPGFSMQQRSDVEAAVIGHGEVEGPFTEIADLAIERDPDFPIRVTVQFYKATSNGVVSADDMREIHEQIQQVYDDADYVGSLVLDGRQGRPTDYDGDHTQPDDWWERFWEHSRERLDMSEEEASELWQRLRR
ncbi:hypothetical protein [Leptothoe sp. PORK10 BA2]|uniref:hypothetical protein n=1 Tax=Leptothoe sp. PORK10 BA2 TaxID=3110254 RepID=UPI002B1F37D6|nr:hypothetical protein [Leptothoe sp. PORK10 BA2]MEA5464280.1 hypothetical protein [Leptothoe sp. PORK10 BA2]